MSQIIVVIAMLSLCNADYPWAKMKIGQSLEQYRKSGSMPVKVPEFKCRCPPAKECVLDYKINKDMPEFLQMRGVMKTNDVEKFRRNFEAEEEKEETTRSSYLRRNWGTDPQQTCCCPPRGLLVPAFITEKKFDTFVDDFKVGGRSKINFQH